MTRDLFERHASIRLLIYVVLVIAFMVLGGMIWQVLVHYQDAIIVLFLAWIIAFTLRPVAVILEGRRIPPVLAVALVYLGLIVLAVGSIFLAIPVIREEVSRLTTQASTLLSPANIQALGARLARALEFFGLSAQLAQTLVRQLTTELPRAAGDLSGRLVTTVEGMAGTLLTLFAEAVLVVIISFYIMLDGERVVEHLIARLPPPWIADVRLFQRHVDAAFGGFLRATLVIGTVYAALNWVVLALLGHPAGLLFALLAGVVLMVPIVGPPLSMAPPLLLIVLNSPSSVLVRDLVIAIIALFIAQQLTLQLVAPRVMSAHVGLPPLVFFIALLVGVREAGFWGALFAGPVAAVVLAMVDTFFERWRASSGLYPEAEPTALGPPEGGSLFGIEPEPAPEDAATGEGGADGHEPEPGRHPVGTGS
ncbi:MAG TPA: AI-2E family transporter [Ktedonobacterales bacterium]|nr:AI-2E family transporter [Ktedonobacterales bacterium]